MKNNKNVSFRPNQLYNDVNAVSLFSVKELGYKVFDMVYFKYVDYLIFLFPAYLLEPHTDVHAESYVAPAQDQEEFSNRLATREDRAGAE